jgi:glycosyltransferase involved in cell wall biosynthesis
MRVLHVVKTSDGASWAASQVSELVRLGIDVHAALPSATGRTMDEWRNSGATLHFLNLDFPVGAPWRLATLSAAACSLVSGVAPDIIHIHNVGPALLIRHALRDRGPLRIFQVPGPLHLEHAFFRQWELLVATDRDRWVGSSRYIVSLYRKAGICPDRLFTSYYGAPTQEFQGRDAGFMRRMLGIPSNHAVVGNISYIYPPKYHLGQFIGLKAHEDLIDALSLVVAKRADVTGVLVGGIWGKNPSYELKLRHRAQALGRGRILMPGRFQPADVRRAWRDFDCAVHVPLSENCGGVVEPLLSGVPTIAGKVGGLPEVVMDGLTGRSVPIRNPRLLAEAIESVIDDQPASRILAAKGRALVQTMFDVRRTSREIAAVYRHVLDPAVPRPHEFDSLAFARAAA